MRIGSTGLPDALAYKNNTMTYWITYSISLQEATQFKLNWIDEYFDTKDTTEPHLYCESVDLEYPLSNNMVNVLMYADRGFNNMPTTHDICNKILLVNYIDKNESYFKCSVWDSGISEFVKKDNIYPIYLLEDFHRECNAVHYFDKILEKKYKDVTFNGRVSVYVSSFRHIKLTNSEFLSNLDWYYKLENDGYINHNKCTMLANTSKKPNNSLVCEKEISLKLREVKLKLNFD